MLKEKRWKVRGYVSLSKSGKALSLVVENKRYIVNITNLLLVLRGEREYTRILEHPEGGQPRENPTQP